MSWDNWEELLAAKYLKEVVGLGQELAETIAILIKALETVGDLKADKESYDKAEMIYISLRREREIRSREEEYGRRS